MSQFFIKRFNRPEILVGGSSRLTIGRGRCDFQDVDVIRPDCVSVDSTFRLRFYIRINLAKADSLSIVHLASLLLLSLLDDSFPQIFYIVIQPLSEDFEIVSTTWPLGFLVAFVG
jgi:hypothetical protein